jgi:hypothetical protein
MIIFPFSVAVVFFFGSLYVKKAKNTCYIFGIQINNMYIRLNEKRHSGPLLPYGKKKEQMREHYTDLQ